MSCEQNNPQKGYRLNNYKKLSCRFCNSNRIVKKGYRKTNRGKIQRFLCRDCKKSFVLNDGFFRMRNKSGIITMCLDLYYNGLSSRKIVDYLKQFFSINLTHKSILEWIKRYVRIIKRFVSNLQPRLNSIYHADEIFVNCKGKQNYFWDIIDRGTRFLVATHYSEKRDSKSAKILFLKVKNKPLHLFTDRLQGYKKAYRKVWGSKKWSQDKNCYTRLKADVDKRNNIVERIQGTIRDRVKTMRAFKNKDSAELILEGLVIWYNFIRKHQGINMTPSEKAGIELDLGINKWLGLIRFSICFSKYDV